MKTSFAAFATLVAIAIALTGQPSHAEGFVYTSFDSAPGIILQSGATLAQNHLRLTPAMGGISGGAWYDAKENVQNGFQTVFQLQITEKGSSGADGLAFVIQNNPTPELGYPGCNLGYGGIKNLFVIKFNNYHFPDHAYGNVWGAYDEVAVLMPHSPATPLWDSVNNTIAATTNGVAFSDGQIHTVKIVYVPGNLQVFIDDPANPLMTVYVNLAKAMNLDDGRAWVGFTAATGADWQNQDLISWTFNSSPDTTPNALRMLSQTEIITPTTSAAVTYLGNRTPASPATPLPVDPAFGYALPGDTGLTQQIEASTDLVHWTSLTNASFYFRDRESTNFPQRFYRFRNN
jgi:hypothetical protein